MNKLVLIAILLIGTLNSSAQITSVEVKFPLPDELNESSGGIFFNGHLISHNDSGNENQLYELDTVTGEIARTVSITNATNVDWEDIAQDDNSIFIADIGNNSGNRTDLKIYKISKNEYLNNDDVSAEVINFNYSDQSDFTPSPNNTKWDAEAIISVNPDELMLITKNWVDGTTKAYPIPKSSGTYSVEPIESTLESEGLITGATHNPSTGKVYMVGYSSLLQPFVWVSENFTDNDIFSGTNTKTPLTGLGFEQVEGIISLSANRYFMTSETFSIASISDNAKLMSLSTGDSSLSIKGKTKADVTLYPNPVTDQLIVKAKHMTSIEVFDTKSHLIMTSSDHKLNVSSLEKGLYIVKVHFSNKESATQKIIKH